MHIIQLLSLFGIFSSIFLYKINIRAYMSYKLLRHSDHFSQKGLQNTKIACIIVYASIKDGFPYITNIMGIHLKRHAYTSRVCTRSISIRLFGNLPS